MTYKPSPAPAPSSTPALPLWAWRLAFGSCALAVLVLALVPTDVPVPSTGWDKSNHLLAFSVMVLLGRRACPGRTAAVLAALLAYGALIEVLQSFTPNRSAQLQDLAADAVGLALGCGLDRLTHVMRRLRNRQQA